MARFRIEGSDLDIEALEKQVDAAIEAKRGTRFTDAELERLRSLPLRPRLRREDLPRGLSAELSAIRARLPELPPAPGSVPASAPARERTEDAGSQRRPPDMAYLWETGATGIRGRVLGLIRRLARRVFHTTTNLEEVLVQQQDYAREMVAAAERELSAVEQRLERSFDVLKDNLDARLDQTADWAGAHLSVATGTLEERHERLLHLSHNLVFELTNARLDLEQMQARLNEMARRMEELETRGRTLEKLTLDAD